MRASADLGAGAGTDETAGDGVSAPQPSIAGPLFGVPTPQPWFGVIRWGALLVALAGAAIVGTTVWRHLGGAVPLSPGLNDPDWAAVVGGAVLLGLGLSAFFLRPELGIFRRQILTSIAWAVTLLGGLVLLWVLIDSSSVRDDWVGTPVLNETQLEAVVRERFPAAESVYRVPTGVQIQSVEFKSAANVEVTGFVWQFYGDDAPPDLVEGFGLPDALRDAYSATEVYRWAVPGGEVVGWYIAATLRQSFDYQYYPFERENVWLRLWSRDFDRRVLLVPDFDAYKDLTPATLPGIERSFVHGGWDPLYSGFSLFADSYNVDFGAEGSLANAAYPELYFNFVLQRDFLGPFTEHLVYASAVALLLFGLLALTSSNDATRGRFGITTAGVLGSCGVFLFGVIAKHNQIRTSLDTQQITYLEAVPVLLYGMIVLVALNAIVVASPLDVPLLEYRDNRFPELVYWPLLFGLLFAVTYAVFF